VTDLHLDPPMTMGRVHAVQGWILPVAAVVFVALAIGAMAGWLFWDEPITRWVVDARTSGLDAFFRRVSSMGSTRVVIVVSVLAALAAWRRCPRLAIAIVVVALTRPFAEAVIKELVSRDRPIGDRLVNGEGFSFPSGHPLATAASWGMLPLVVALYTRRRWLWWAVATAVWTLALFVAASRVYLGVHFTSDVFAGLVLAVLGVAGAERFITATHGGCGSRGCLEVDDVDPELVDRPVLDAPT
jgi:membrane-associated phospholipid phosphatase